MPLANHLLALPRIRHLIHISRLTLRILPAPAAFRLQTRPTTITSTAPKELTMRINPSDILFSILTLCLTILAAFTLGGLAAHPFAC